MSRYIEGETRSQSMLFPERLEESLTTGSKSMAPVFWSRATRWAVVMRFMGSIPVWADPSGPFTETDGPRRVRQKSNAAHQCQISTDRGSTGRDSGFALARAVRVQQTAR